MTITLEEFSSLIQAPRETRGLEFKEARSQWSQESLFEYAVAIANERGGKLILGVTDRLPRKIVGTAAFRNPDAICMKVLQVVHFRVEIDELLLPEGRVLVVHIPSRPHGTPLQMMTNESLRQRFKLPEAKAETVSRIIRDAIDANLIKQPDNQSQSKRYRKYVPFGRKSFRRERARRTRAAVTD